MAEEPQGAQPSTQADTADVRPVYEVGFHLLPSIPEEGVAAAVQKIRALLGDAEIIAEGAPAKTSLAYAIERSAAGKTESFTSSYFGWIKFAAERDIVEPLQEKLRAMQEVLRFIVIGTVREEQQAQKRAVFTSDRLEGRTLERKTEAERGGEVSEEELEKSLGALTGEDKPVL